MLPGQYSVQSSALEMRVKGLHLRDTFLILGPNGKIRLQYLFRAALSGTVVENASKYGTGGLWIDGCRIQTPGTPRESSTQRELIRKNVTRAQRLGRWPTNVLLVHGPGCVMAGTKSMASNGHFPSRRGPSGKFSGSTGGLNGQLGLTEVLTKVETVAAWHCTQDCVVPVLDSATAYLRASGNKKQEVAHSVGNQVYGKFKPQATQPDYHQNLGGGASRFFPQLSSSHAVETWFTKLLACPGVSSEHEDSNVVRSCGLASL